MAVLFDRLGPYHLARIAAASRVFPTIAIEFGADSAEYAWARVDAKGLFPRHTITEGRADQVPTRLFAKKLFAILDDVRPEVLAVPGWAHRGSLLSLRWAVQNDVPVVMMSASQRQDAERTRLRELMKERIVALCSSAVVGGRPQHDYIRDLGMREQVIFTGYDVVDNDYFARGADAARRVDPAERERLGLPGRFFLASNRFIPKKNLGTLFDAYALYRRRQGDDAPKLVLLGDGLLRDDLIRKRAELGLQNDILMPGFMQYGELPSYYGLAEAFVHVSTTEQWGLVVNEAMAAGLPVVVSRSCGCSVDLVRDGENGFSFDSESVEQLSRALALLGQGPEVRARMGARSRDIISRWSPATFAQQLLLACEAALGTVRPTPLGIDKFLLRALTLR